MTKWEKFEIECTEYLNNTYGTSATFIHQGGSDSTLPDIKTAYDGSYFYIEVKQEANTTTFSITCSAVHQRVLWTGVLNFVTLF